MHTVHISASSCYLRKGSQTSCNLIDTSPPSGVVDEIVATGPVPALVMALTWKVYEVKGFKPGTSTVVVSASWTGISCEESDPSTCIVYPVMTPFRFSTGRGDQESSAVVKRL